MANWLIVARAQVDFLSTYQILYIDPQIWALTSSELNITNPKKNKLYHCLFIVKDVYFIIRVWNLLILANFHLTLEFRKVGRPVLLTLFWENTYRKMIFNIHHWFNVEGWSQYFYWDQPFNHSKVIRNQQWNIAKPFHITLFKKLKQILSTVTFTSLKWDSKSVMPNLMKMDHCKVFLIIVKLLF